MKRTCVFIGLVSIFCILLATSLYGGTIYGIIKSGKLTSFNSNDEQVSGVRFAGYERIDTDNKTDALSLLARNDIKTVFAEIVDGVTFYYCYTPSIIKFKTVDGRKINLCIAIKKDGAVIGSPLIKGSV